jgi:hypothetical protein
MTETQARYISDAQAAFENKILESHLLFDKYARKYILTRGLEPFLEWCWRHKIYLEGDHD